MKVKKQVSSLSHARQVLSRCPLVDRERCFQSSFKRSLLQTATAFLSPSADLLDTIFAERLERKETPLTLLLGPQASGKSTFIAQWAQSKRLLLSSPPNEEEDTEDSETATFLMEYFVATTRHSRHLSTLLSQVCTRLVEFFALDSVSIPCTERSLLACFKQLLAKVNELQDKSVVLLIDGIEMLTMQNGASAGIHWIPHSLGENVRVILTATVNDLELVTALCEDTDSVPAFLTQENDAQKSSNRGKLNQSSENEETLCRGFQSRQGIKIARFESLGNDSFDVSAAIRTFFQQQAKSQPGRTSTPKSLAPLASPSVKSPSALEKKDMKESVILLESHVIAIAGKFNLLRSIGVLFETLKAIQVAARANYNVHSLVELCTSPSINDLEDLYQALLQFFSRGNYPTATTVKTAWSAVQNSVHPSLREPSSLNAKSALPSKDEADQRAEVKRILANQPPSPALASPASRKTSGESDEEYADDFDEDLDQRDRVNEQVLQEPELLNRVPLYLLGGVKIEPPGDWFLRAVGYLCSARFAMSVSELESVLTLASKEEDLMQQHRQQKEEQGKALPSPQDSSDGLLEIDDVQGGRKKSLKELAENSFEEWLFNESIMSSSPKSMDGQGERKRQQSLVPESVSHLLTVLLPFFAPLSYKQLVGIPRNNSALRHVVTKTILHHKDLAPSKHAVIHVGEELERERMELAESRAIESLKVRAALHENDLNKSSDTSLCEHSSGVTTSYEPAWVVDTVKFEKRNRAARWRLMLIRFFASKKLSQRKAEEYFWLLESNGRWASLTGAVEEIETFSFLWNDPFLFRFDILRYWQRLSSTCKARQAGPIDTLLEDRIVDHLQQQEDGSDQDDERNTEEHEPPAASRHLAPVLHPSQKYDPVDHYLRTSEEFLFLADPRTPKASTDLSQSMKLAGFLMIALCEFFWEFGEHEHLAPLYLHPSVAEDELETIKVQLPHKDESKLQWFGRQGLELHLNSTSKVLADLAEQREAMLLEQHMAQRQVAASKLDDDEGNIQEEMKRSRSQFMGLLLKQQESLANRAKEDRKLHGLIYEGNKTGENFYSYQRWIWVQYPTMAMVHASSVRIMTNQEKSKRMTLSLSKSHRRGKTDVVAAKKNSIDFWTRKKQDPSQVRPAQPRISQVKSQVELLPSSVSTRSMKQDSVNDNTVRTKQGGKLRKIDTSAQADDRNDPILRRGVGPFLNEVAKLPKNTVPFSSPSHRTLSKGTRFPSFDAAQKEDDLLNIFHGGILDTQVIEQTFKTVAATNNHSSGLSFVSSNLPAHLQTYPTTEQEARVAELQGMLTTSRKTLDYLRFQANDKELELEKLMQMVYERNNQDEFTNACISRGESIVGNLKTRLHELYESIARFEHTNRFLLRILRVCEAFPARVEKHVLQLEARLSEMKDDRLSFTKDIEEVVAFTNRMNLEQKPKLLSELEKRQFMHKRVIERLIHWRTEDNERHLERVLRNKNREAIAKAVQEKELTLEEMHHGWNRPHRQMLYEKVLGDYILPLVKEKKERDLYRKLCKLARSKDPAAISTSFSASQAKVHELETEKQQAIDRKQALRERLAKLIQERNQLQAESASKRRTNSVVQQMNSNCGKAESRLASAKAELTSLTRAIQSFKENLIDFQYRLAKAMPPTVQFAVNHLDHIDLHLVHNDEELTPLSSADLESTRALFQGVLKLLRVSESDVPDIARLPTTQLPKHRQDLKKNPTHQGNQPLSKKKPSKQDIQRRKFLFGSGIRKPSKDLVQLPPPITRASLHQ